MKMKSSRQWVLVILAYSFIGAAIPAVSQTGSTDPTTASLQQRVADLEKSLAEVKALLAAHSAAPGMVPSPAVTPVPAPLPVPPVDGAVTATLEPTPTEGEHTLGPLQF